MKDYLKTLNEEQLEAVKKIEGYNLVIAGAGTGKTHTMISKVAYMIDNHIDPSEILMLTFTNKAAEEMKERLVSYIGDDGKLVTASTFHSFFVKILRRFVFKLPEFKRKFGIMSEPDRATLMSQCEKLWISTHKEQYKGYDKKRMPFPTYGELLYVHSESVNKMKSMAELVRTESKYCGRPVQHYINDVLEIVDMFETKKIEYNVMDFDDILKYSYLLISQNEGVLKYISCKYKYLICDEYQDTNTIQEAILSLMARANGNLTVVGDDNQSIYAFRGAEIQNILTFADRYPNVTTIKLVRNYRSTQEILDFSNAFMHHAVEGIRKDLVGNSHGHKVELRALKDTSVMSKEIVDKIEALKQSGKDYGDIAVIARSGNHLNEIESLLNIKKIPYEKFGGQKYMDSAPVQDVLAFIRIVCNPRDALGWNRVLQLYRGIGAIIADKLYKNMVNNETYIEELKSREYKNRTYSEYFDELYNTLEILRKMPVYDAMRFLASDYYPALTKRVIRSSSIDDDEKEKQLRNVDHYNSYLKPLVDIAKNYDDLTQYLDDMLLSQSNGDELVGDKVNLTTIHSAKGLEYDTVFVINTVQDMFPRTMPSDDKDAEELRCLYVACTRAKTQLYIYMPMAKWSYDGGKPHMEDTEMAHFLTYDDVMETADVDKNAKELEERGAFALQCWNMFFGKICSKEEPETKCNQGEDHADAERI